MKKSIRSLLLVTGFSLIALLVPLLYGSEIKVYAATDFVIEDGVLTEYTGNGGNVTIPEEVTVIGYNVFRGRSSLTGVTIPEGVTKIESGAFMDCEGLKSVTLPSTLTTIEDNAFNECTGLKSIVIPGSVSVVKDYAFAYCEGLTSLTISNGVKTIDYAAFMGCKGLSRVTVPGSVANIKDYAFADCESLTALTISNGVKTIDFCAFENCSSLTSVTIPGSVSTVGRYAFENCTSMTGLKLSEGVKTLERYSFLSCNALKSVTIPSSVTTLDAYAFQDCAGLKTVTILTKNPTIDTTSPAFYDSPVATVYYAGTEAEWKASELDSQFTSKINVVYNCTAFAITSQPASQTVTLGKSLTLSVKANGVGLSYQWYYKKKGATAWSVWNGHTHASETCMPNETWNGIQLYCKVKNAAGSTLNSAVATIQVIQPLAITAQPQSKSIILGRSLTLSVKATGEGLSYQWYYKKKGAAAFSVWNNRTKASETVTPNVSWDGIQLYCRVKDSSGKTVNSSAATINVLSITYQPANVTVASGSNATFTVKATGAGLKYQWQYKKKGATAWSNWNGRTTASTTATSNDSWQGMQVRCKVTDSGSNTLYSSVATITIAAALKITQQPNNVTASVGDDVAFIVKASGSGVKYQWQYKKKGAASWSNWNGRTTAITVATANATWSGMQVRCKVTDATGKNLYSSAATITIK